MLLHGPIESLGPRGCAGRVGLCPQQGSARGPGAAAAAVQTHVGSSGGTQEPRGVERLFSSLTNYASQERQGCLGWSITVARCRTVGCECFVILHSVA